MTMYFKTFQKFIATVNVHVAEFGNFYGHSIIFHQ